LAREKWVAHAAKPEPKASSSAALKNAMQKDKTLTKITPKIPHNEATKPDGFVAQVPASAPKFVAKK
jgi:hypothetical protein